MIDDGIDYYIVTCIDRKHYSKQIAAKSHSQDEISKTHLCNFHEPASSVLLNIDVEPFALDLKHFRCQFLFSNLLLP